MAQQGFSGIYLMGLGISASLVIYLLVLIAFVIAIPVAWWGMHQWLKTFADRTMVSRCISCSTVA